MSLFLIHQGTTTKYPQFVRRLHGVVHTMMPWSCSPFDVVFVKNILWIYLLTHFEHELESHTLFYTLSPRLNGCRFPSDIFKCTFWFEKKLMSIIISLKCVPKVPIDNEPALGHIMAWCRTGDKQLNETLVVLFTDIYRRHSTLMS